MNIIRDILPLTNFKRNTAAFLRKLKKTGQPVVLTVNGKAELVVHDAASYQKLLDLIDRAAATEGIARGLADVEAGRVRPFRRAMEQIRRKHEVAD